MSPRLTTDESTWMSLALTADLLRRREIEVTVDYVDGPAGFIADVDEVSLQITVEHLPRSYTLALSSPVEQFALMERLSLALATRAAELPLSGATPPSPPPGLERSCPSCRAPATSPCTPVHAGEREASDWSHPSRIHSSVLGSTRANRTDVDLARQVLVDLATQSRGDISLDAVRTIASALVRLSPGASTLTAADRASGRALYETVRERVAMLYPSLPEVSAELYNRVYEQTRQATDRGTSLDALPFSRQVDLLADVTIRYLREARSTPSTRGPCASCGHGYGIHQVDGKCTAYIDVPCPCPRFTAGLR